jgi:hypothetical protein
VMDCRFQLVESIYFSQGYVVWAWDDFNGR